MKSAILGLASLATLSFAFPQAAPSYNSCLTDDQGQLLVDRYIAAISQTDSDLGDSLTTAKKLVAKGYQETSDSANTALGIPVRLYAS